jgi:hypothetical protein
LDFFLKVVKPKQCYYSISENCKVSIRMSSSISTNITWTGILGATATIFLTTCDDCVWLVPYLSTVTYPNVSIRIQHATLFAMTLLSLTSTAVIITYLFQFLISKRLIQNGQSSSSSLEATQNSNTTKKYEIVFESIGAAFGWCLAIYFYYKSWCKRQRKRLRQQQKEEEQNVIVATTTDASVQPPPIEASSSSGAVSEASPLIPSMTSTIIDSTHDPMDTSSTSGTFANYCTIITLTISGALDEVSYFPSLLLGHVFTGPELIIGTLITVILLLLIVTQLLHYCQPMLQCLDRIPLYAIISLYSILLTINIIIEIRKP